MDNKIFSLDLLKKRLRKSTSSQKKVPEQRIFSDKKITNFTLDRFIPTRINFYHENSSDNQTLNVYSKSKELKKNEKSSYLKIIESELIENTTPKYKEIALSLMNKETMSENKGRSVIYNETKKKRNNLATNLNNIQSSIDENLIECITKTVEPMNTFNFGLLSDNFYSNVFDWQVGECALIATKKSMISFNPLIFKQVSNKDYPQICYDSNSEITALKQITNEHVVVCDSNCVLYDINRNVVTELRINNNKIMSIDMIDHNLIVLGSENSYVFFLDLRFKNSLTPLYEHMNEVCKVKYNPQMNMLVSGGNDNKILLYDMRGKNRYLKIFTHNAAIKALDFDRTGSRLVSGGGTFDKRIKIWDLKKFELINEKVTDSQISNIYSWKNNSIITANGFVSNNIEVWKNEKGFRKSYQFKSHQKRILFLTKSSCDRYLLSGSCDGVINLWKIPEDIEKKNSNLINDMIR